MKNSVLSTKLLVSLGLIVIMALLIGVSGIVGLLSAKTPAEDLYGNKMAAAEAMDNIKALFEAQRNDLRNIFLLRDDPEEVQGLIEGIKTSDKKVLKEFTKYETTITNKGAEQYYFTVKGMWIGPYADMKDELWALINDGDFDTAYRQYLSVGATCIAHIDEGLATAELMDTEHDERSAATVKPYEDALMSMLVLILSAGIALAVFLMLYVSGVLNKVQYYTQYLTSFKRRNPT